VNPIADVTPSKPGGPFDLAWKRTADGYLDIDTRSLYQDPEDLTPAGRGEDLSVRGDIAHGPR